MHRKKVGLDLDTSFPSAYFYLMHSLSICRFALMEAKMALVEILRKFSFEPSERTPEPLPVRNKGLTLTVRGDDLWLNIVRR